MEKGGISIDNSTTKESLSIILGELENINHRLSILASEAAMFNKNEDDQLFCMFGGMFYTSPALLHELVRKCHDDRYKIHPKIFDVLVNHGFIINSDVPPNIKKYVISHFKITKDGISMSM